MTFFYIFLIHIFFILFFCFFFFPIFFILHPLRAPLPRTSSWRLLHSGLIESSPSRLSIGITFLRPPPPFPIVYMVALSIMTATNSSRTLQCQPSHPRLPNGQHRQHPCLFCFTLYKHQIIQTGAHSAKRALIPTHVKMKRTGD